MRMAMTPGTMEEKLAALGRKVDGTIEKVRRLKGTELEDAVRTELEVWKAILEDIQVQMKLGGMEVGERVEPYIERVTETFGDVRHRLEGIFSVVDDEAFEASVTGSLKELRSEIARAEELS